MSKALNAIPKSNIIHSMASRPRIRIVVVLPVDIYRRPERKSVHDFALATVRSASARYRWTQVAEQNCFNANR